MITKYFIFFLALLVAVEPRCREYYHHRFRRVFRRKAVVNIDGPSARGRLVFEEIPCRRVRITGTISNLTPGKHGMHVHEFGDTARNCAAAGGHYNPFNRNHGSPRNSIKKRHVGDLGNIFANKKGVANVRIVDRIIRLRGRRNIIGRAIVVHAQRDDLGLGGNAESLITGNAGARVGCAVIGLLTK